MSPEQARGDRVVGATDIFSLGILLYELTTGRHPFEAESQLGVLNAILAQAVIPPRRINHEIPLPLEALILKMLEKDSRLRPGAAEVELALTESSNRRAGPETGLTTITFKRQHFKAALHLANRRGDNLNQVLCLTYLTIIYRKRGQLEEAQSYVSQSMEVATAGQMGPYIGMANANKAWLGWRQNDYSAVNEHGRAALDSWKEGQASYPFQWAALWPLIGAQLAQNNIPEAIEYANAMLAPTQQRLPTELQGVVVEALNEWGHNHIKATRTRLDRALQLAQQMGYL
ncbi:MAG: hypothetical protein H0U60_08610 [Blastocatellia bacterium]|nr:hypothetical protein [Blastocatellia bacterium]